MLGLQMRDRILNDRATIDVGPAGDVGVVSVTKTSSGCRPSSVVSEARESEQPSRRMVRASLFRGAYMCGVPTVFS